MTSNCNLLLAFSSNTLKAALNNNADNKLRYIK